jgi:capsule biosynthesis phosphatase
VIREEKCIVVDIDGVLCEVRKHDESYETLAPRLDVVEQLREYQKKGFYIILYSARNMRTYGGNIGLINANTAKVLLNWLERHEIPHDEIHFGKPWPGRGGFYVDDKAVRPDEFLGLSYEDILELIHDEKDPAPS